MFPRLTKGEYEQLAGFVVFVFVIAFVVKSLARIMESRAGRYD